MTRWASRFQDAADMNGYTGPVRISVTTLDRWQWHVRDNRSGVQDPVAAFVADFFAPFASAAAQTGTRLHNDMAQLIRSKYPHVLVEEPLLHEWPGAVLSARIDAQEGNTCFDWKFRQKASDIQGMLESWQWRAYLCMTGCTHFVYGEEVVGDDTLQRLTHRFFGRRSLVVPPSAVQCFAYPGMEADVIAITNEVASFWKAKEQSGEVYLDRKGRPRRSE